MKNIIKTSSKQTVKIFLWSFIICVFGGVGCGKHIVNQPLVENLDIQGHRGARGLAPENTIPAFEVALQYKVTTLEFDVVLTADEQLIIHHDTATNPTLCQTLEGSPINRQPIRELTVQQLKKMDCGSQINPNFPEQKPYPNTTVTTLPEFFAFITPKMANHPTLQFNIELKFPKEVSKANKKLSVQAITKAIRNTDLAANITVQSFHLDVLTQVKES